MAINNSAGIFDWGPTGNYIQVDASGRVIATTEPVNGLYPLGYGKTGRALCVDGSGRMVVAGITSATGSVDNGSNLGAGSGIFAGKSGSNLTFKTLIAGSGIAIDGDSSTLSLRSVVNLQNAFNQGGTIVLTGSEPITIAQSGTGGAINIDSYVNTTDAPTINAVQNPITEEDGSAHTGTDESFEYIWEAIKVTATDSVNIGSFGVRLKRTGIITNISDIINGYIYTDNAGSPGSVIGSVSTSMRFGSLTTSYITYQFGVFASVVSGTSYWLVLRKDVAPAGGTIEIDIEAVGTGCHARSSNGTVWTLEDSKQGWYQLYASTYHGGHFYSANSYAVYAESVNADALYAQSTNRYGIYGYSVNNFGVRAKSDYNIALYASSTHMVAVQGNSTNSYGIRGDSVSLYAIYGLSEQNHGIFGQTSSSATDKAGVYGQSVNGPGVYGTSAGLAIQGYSTASYAVFGTSIANAAAGFSFYANSPNTLSEVVRISKSCHTTAAASGIGASEDFYLSNAAGSAVVIAGRISTIFVNTTVGQETSRVGIWTRNNGGAIAERFTVMEDGAVQGNNNTWNVDATGNATFNTVTITGGTYKESIAIDGWTHNGSGLYYHDLAHSLNTRDVMAEFYDSNTYKTVLVDDIERTDVDTVRVTVAVSGLALRALLRAVR